MLATAYDLVNENLDQALLIWTELVKKLNENLDQALKVCPELAEKLTAQGLPQEQAISELVEAHMSITGANPKENDPFDKVLDSVSMRIALNRIRRIEQGDSNVLSGKK